MDDPQRLSRIDTLWSMVRGATPGGPDPAEAQRRLLARYGGSVRRYLQAALKDPEAVEEVYQEFALRLVRGDFRTADPQRGRFRNYVKTVIYRLMMDWHRHTARHRRHQGLQQDPADDGAWTLDRQQSDDALTCSWREDLLRQAWDALRQWESESGSPYHLALQLRVQHSDLRSAELARLLSDRLGRPVQAGTARIWVHRAREKFADFLIESVAHSLDSATADAVEDELIELNLLHYGREALQRWRAGS